MSRARKCLLCARPATPEFYPFCSEGCKNRDLLNWLGDGYRVPGPPADPDAIAREINTLDRDA